MGRRAHLPAEGRWIRLNQVTWQMLRPVSNGADWGRGEIACQNENPLPRLILVLPKSLGRLLDFIHGYFGRIERRSNSLSKLESEPLRA